MAIGSLGKVKKMGIFDKIKKAISGRPVTGVALIVDVEEIQEALDDIVAKVLADQQGTKAQESN